ncbi:hypothetical protein EGW08_012716 [Elysia chlorotica]|uniref:C2H2-type domain-containing protein n=1 Tax=Elysia chlorotica TaxID=188477 RepID=A0A3S1BBE7_ELYCH|nr:hypothetical protein EGW08_012716 [Elysia chlorotica]
MRQVHGGMIRCEECGLRCQNKIQLTRHWLDAHCEDTIGATDKLKCFKCNSTEFKDKYELECHWLRHKYDRRQRRLSHLSDLLASNSREKKSSLSVVSTSSTCFEDNRGKANTVSKPHSQLSPQMTASMAAIEALKHVDPIQPHRHEDPMHIPQHVDPIQPHRHEDPMHLPQHVDPMKPVQHVEPMKPPQHVDPMQHPRHMAPLYFWPAAATPQLHPHMHFRHPRFHHHCHPHFLPPPPPPLPPPPHFFMPPYPGPDTHHSRIHHGCDTSNDASQVFPSSTQSPRHDHAYVEPTTISQWPRAGYQYSHHMCGHKAKMKWKKYLKLMMKGKVPPLWSGMPPWANPTQETKTADGKDTSEFQIACKFCDKVIGREWISWHQKKECPVLSFHKCEVCDRFFHKRHLLLKHMQEQNHYVSSSTRSSNPHTEINSSVLSSLQRRMNETLTFDTDVESAKHRSHQSSEHFQQARHDPQDSGNLISSVSKETSVFDVESLTYKGGLNLSKHKCEVCKIELSSADHLRIHLREHLDQVESVQKVREWRKRSADFFQTDFSQDSLATEESVSVADSEITSTTGSAVTAGSSVFSGATASTSTSDRWTKPHKKGGSHRHHRKGEISICEFCGEHFIFQKNLENHIKEKHPKSKLQCPVCHKTFSWKKRGKFYERHMESHYGVKIFKHKCEFCEKTFLEKSKLASHVAAKHTHEQVHKCGVCGKSYANKSSLVRHERHHTGTRPYQCTVCSESFMEKRELLRHSATHTGVAPFCCDKCGQGFTLKTSLTAHKKNKHPH